MEVDWGTSLVPLVWKLLGAGGLNPVLRKLQESTLATKFTIALCCPWREGEMGEFRGKRENRLEKKCDLILQPAEASGSSQSRHAYLVPQVLRVNRLQLWLLGLNRLP